MYRNHWYLVLAAVLLLLSIPLGAAAAETESGDVACFSPEDFAGREPIAGICITEVPERHLGVTCLGSREIRPGDILTSEQAAQMTFTPVKSEQDVLAEVRFLPIYPGHVAEEAAMTLSIRGKEDKPPVAEDSALETYKNLANTGKLRAHDPEGEAMTFAVTRQPRRGTVTIGEDGSFTYTPKNNKVGIDSFTYTATDPAGKTSREATVTITILKPTEAARYTDTAGKDCCFAAEWMKHTGIFTGEELAGNSCFSPEKTVTRGEFVTMLVRALDLPVEKDAAYTGYSDEIPGWLRPYLAAAVRAGLTADLGEQEAFGADSPMESGEAAAMLCQALHVNVSTDVMAEDTAAAWIRSALEALEARGIHITETAGLTRGETAQILYQMSQALASGEK